MLTVFDNRLGMTRLTIDQQHAVHDDGTHIFELYPVVAVVMWFMAMDSP